MNLRYNFRFIFRLLFRGFQEAESRDEFAKVGYSWLLPFVLAAGVLLTYVIPSTKLIENIVRVLSKHLGVDSQIIADFPAILAASILLWLTGLFIPSLKSRVGSFAGKVIITLADRFAMLGERLAEQRLLSFSVVVVLSFFGAMLYLEDSRMVTLRANRVALADRWLAELSLTIETATHSVRDIPALQRIEPRLPRSEAVALQKQMGPEWGSLVCLADFLETVFAPIPDSNDPGLLKGEIWRQRMRGALASVENNECVIVTEMEKSQGAVPAVPARARSLYNLLVGRSYYRLVGETCSDHWALAKAFKFIKEVDRSILAPSRDSALGNIYGCAALAYASDQVKDLDSICHSAEDCYNLAIENHTRSSAKYEACSFSHLRALNNKADLTMKLAQRKWFGSGTPGRLSFFNNEVATRSLSDYSAEMIKCMGYERTPTEVMVTIAQAFGTLAQAKGSIGDEQKRLFLKQSGFFLATSALHAPDEFSSWELRYFCSAFKKSSSDLDPDFVSSLNLSGLPESVRGDLSRRIQEICQ